MDHATAHERIADLALEPDGLARLAASTAAEDRALLDHARTCPTCRSVVEASRRLSDGLRRALAELPGASGLEPIAAPDSLRAAVLGAAHRDRAGAGARTLPLDGTVVSGSRRPRLDWLRPRWVTGLAAALAIAILAGVVAGSQLERLARDEGAESAVAVVATLNRILAADDHRIVALRTPGGTAAGSVAWSRQDFAVLASTLSRPAAGTTYRCWLEWGGRSAPIGTMDFAGGTAYWTGTVGDWASVAFDPGARFVVTLEPSRSGPQPSAPTTPAVLVADLGT